MKVSKIVGVAAYDGLKTFSTTHWRNIIILSDKKLGWPFGQIFKAEMILKGSLDLISSPSPSMKIQVMGLLLEA